MGYGLTLFLFSASTIVGYIVVPQPHRPSVLLLASYVLLGVWSLFGLMILLLITTLTYACGLLVERKRSNAVVAVCLTTILCPLCLSKLSLPQLGDAAGTIPGAPMQFGLAFFSLQAVSYVVDVRAQRLEAQRGLTQLALYLALFPKLVAGPIERAHSFMSQLGQLTLPNFEDAVRAGKLILLGLFSKFVLADTFGRLGVELTSEASGGAVIALSCVAYSYQIYLDFVGYSAMAIGAGRLLGIHLSENFRTPYASRSLQEFWRRWHMTLSFWFRDYLYKPLGGNQAPEQTRWAAVLLVFVCSGLWHGSTVSFLAWGALHGLLYLIGTTTLAARKRVWASLGLARVRNLHCAFQVLFVFFLATVGWVFFRSPDLGAAFDTLRRAAAITDANHYFDLGTTSVNSVALTIAMLLTVGALDMTRFFERFGRQESTALAARVGSLVTIDVMLIGLALFGSAEQSSFIYFRF